MSKLRTSTSRWRRLAVVASLAATVGMVAAAAPAQAVTKNVTWTAIKGLGWTTPKKTIGAVTAGYQFAVTSSCKVTQIGVLDSDHNGRINSSTTVALYGPAGEQLAIAVVPGFSIPNGGGWAYVKLAKPVTLKPGKFYSTVRTWDYKKKSPTEPMAYVPKGQFGSVLLNSHFFITRSLVNVAPKVAAVPISDPFHNGQPDVQATKWAKLYPTSVVWGANNLKCVKTVP